MSDANTDILVNSNNLINVSSKRINTQIPIQVEDGNSHLLTGEDNPSLMQTYFDKRFESLKRQTRSDNEDVRKHIKLDSRNKTEFKYKSNKTQFEFNQDLINIVQEASSTIQDKLVSRPLKGNSGQNFFFKKLHSSYRALKCQKNPFCFILITFFVQKLLKF